MTSYLAHYHGERNHQGKENVILFPTACCPHIEISITATLPGDVEAIVSFYTNPVNMTLAENAANGAFLTSGVPVLKISADLNAGSVSIPAGTYTVGAIKNSMDSWTMALSPGELGEEEKPDMSKLIKLDSEFVKSSEPGEHSWVYIGPGQGKFEGKVAFEMGFGPLVLTGCLSDTLE